MHRDLGPVGWHELLDLLSNDFSVHAVTLPGFGDEPLPAWARSIAHLASIVGHRLDALGLGPLPIVGLGFGGWVAAQLAATSPSRVASLALVSPMGLRPGRGEVIDQFLFSAAGYAALSIGGDEPFDEEQLDRAREAVTRVAWKPIGHDPALAGLLEPTRLPAVVVWGSDDLVVPVSTAEQWGALLRTSVSVIAGAPHHVEYTHASAVAALVAPCLQMG